MIDIAALISANAARWAAMQLNPSRIAAFDAVAARLCNLQAKAMYVAISAATRVPWYVIAVIHERECGQKWDRHLGQGDPLCRPTVNEPAGRGPFFDPNAFFRGALDALIDCPPHAAQWTDWTPGGILTITERYNGLGYASGPVAKDGTRYPPQASPYNFSGTDQYVTGKYVADHDYRHDVVDVQYGCAPILLRMMRMDSSIATHVAPSQPVAPPPPPEHITAPDFIQAIRHLF